MSSRADSMPTPKINTANGIKATEGTGRKNSTVEFVNFRKKLDEPTIKPSTAADTTAMTIPINQARMVSQTATQTTASPNFSIRSAMAVVAGGKNRASTMPSIGNNSQTPQHSTIPTKSKNRYAQYRP